MFSLRMGWFCREKTTVICASGMSVCRVSAVQLRTTLICIKVHTELKTESIYRVYSLAYKLNFHN